MSPVDQPTSGGTDIPDSERPVVQLTWQVRETHRKRFTKEQWAGFVASLDINEEHELPSDTSEASLDRVNDYLASDDWFATEVLRELGSNNTYLSGDDEFEPEIETLP